MAVTARRVARPINAPRASVSDMQPEGARLPFYALMAFTFVLIVVPQEIVPVLASLRIALLAAALAIGSYALARLNAAEPLIGKETEVRLVLVLLVLAILSVPTSFWPGGSVGVITGMYLKSVIIFVLLANVLSTAARLKAMLWLLALCSIAPALGVLKNYREGNLMEMEARVRGYGGGLSSNPNDVALTLNIIIPLAFSLLLCTRRWIPRAVLVATITLATAAITVTLSRAGSIMLACTVVLYLLRLRRGRLWIILAVVLAVIVMATVPGFFDRMATTSDIDTPGSAQERWDNMKKAWTVMLRYPVFGVGIGQNILALNELETYWAPVHNVYLEIGSELGVVALLVYLSLLRHCLRSTKAAAEAWRSAGSPLAHIAQGLHISLLSFSIGVVFYPVAYHFYFYYLAGLAVAVKILARREASA